MSEELTIERIRELRAGIATLPWISRYEHHGREVEPRYANSGSYVYDGEGTQVAAIDSPWIDTGVPFWPDKPNGATHKERDYEKWEANSAFIAAAPEAIDLLLAKLDEMREALKRAEWDFQALISRGDLADEPRAYETLRILQAALAHSTEGKQ